MAFRSRYPDRLAADILRARGINRIVYFHSDHFEPWRLVPGRAPEYRLALGDIESYIRRTEGRPWASRATLFFKANINYAIDRSRALWRGHPDDPIGFVPPEAEQEDLSAAMLGALDGAGRALQVHIHHENITWNDRIRDEAMRAFLDPPHRRVFDAHRLECLVRLNLDLLDRQARIDRDAWFFVHGHWALNASDPHECTVVREIEILRRNGCLGDFTQPSGRPHTDARIDEPYLVRPVPLAKGFDRPEAEPIAAAGAGTVPAERFLIWASEINHRYCSIDHYSGFVRERMAEPGLFARANAELGFAHDGVLYCKTHAHTLHPAYWQENGGAGAFPHDHPGVVAELETLFEAGTAAGAEIEFATVPEVFARLMAAPRPPERDLAAVYRLAEGDPMAEVGCDVAHLTAAGMVPPPPLPPFGTAPAKPIRKRKRRTPLPPRPWPEVRMHAPAKDTDEAPVAALPTAPQLLAEAHSLFAAAGLEDERIGSLAAVATLVERVHTDRSAPVVEIGCGDGRLTALLAHRGWSAVGVDGSEAAVRRAEALAHEQAGGAADSRFEHGTFPGWLAGRGDLDSATAMVGGLLSEGGMSGQAAAIRALASFRLAIVDLGRFMVPRAPGAEQQRLIALFVQGGFESPQLFALGEDGARYAVFRSARSGGLRRWTTQLLRAIGLAEPA